MKLLLRFLNWLFGVTFLRHGDYLFIFIMLFMINFVMTASLMGDALKAFCVTAFTFFIYSVLFRNLMDDELFYLIPSVCGSVLLYVVLMDQFASGFRTLFSSHG
ncbi:hypothetical protein [Pantoea stewartii]|uniref:hypothetical protein n=1 Tax=Pantoea stewartii TaxID=66269 RepID=UPI0021E946C4|nr:hypothetical protein [Pantoea stewartii]UYK96331.1 hypothetical protein NG832_14255 [Pantoea stewartii]